MPITSFPIQTRNVTGLDPLSNNNNSKFVMTSGTGAYLLPISGLTGSFVTTGLLDTSGQYLYNLISSSAAGVSTLNAISGNILLTGTGNITLTRNSQTIIISGNTGAYSNFVTPSQTGLLTGAFVLRTETGGFGGGSSVVGGVTTLGATGITNTGFFTGNLLVSGAGNIVASTGNTTSKLIVISGDTGAYANFLTPSSTGNFITNGMTGALTGDFVRRQETGQFAASGNLTATGINLQSQINTVTTWTGTTPTIFANINHGHNYVTSLGATGITNTGLFTGNVLLSGAGNIVTSTGDNNSKLIIISGNTGAYGNFVSLSQTGGLVSSANTGTFVTTGQTGLLTNVFVLRTETGGFGGGTSQAGVTSLAATGVTNTGYFTGSVMLSGVGNIVISTGDNNLKLIRISGDTGAYANFLTPASTGGFVNATQTGLLTNVFYPLNTNPSNYLTVSSNVGVRSLQTTGAYPSGIISGNVVVSGISIISVTTGAAGQLVISGNTGMFDNFTSDSELLSTSGYIVSLINAASAGVSSLNGQSGVLQILGSGNITIFTGAGFITVSGNTGAYANFLTPSTVGGVRNITLTGTPQSGTISGNVIFTGAGNVSVSTGVSGLGIISGDTGAYANFVSLSQTGGLVSSANTGTFVTTGQTGLLTNVFYPLNSNPSNYLVSSTVGGVRMIVPTGTSQSGNISGNVIITGAGNVTTSTGISGIVVISGNTGAYANFVTLSQTGGLVSSANTGNFVTTGQTGLLTNVFYPLNSNPSNYLTVSSNVGVRTIQTTGAYPSGIVSGNIVLSGAGNTSVYTGINGIIIISGTGGGGSQGASAGVNSVAATGITNTGFFTGDVMFTGAGNIVVSTGIPINKLIVVSGDTGAYANFVSLSQTGNVVNTSQTGGFLTLGNVGGVRGIVATGTTRSGIVSGNVIVTGAGNTTVETGVSGLIIVSGNTGAYANFVTLSQTGNVVNTSQTGGFASIQVTGSPLLSLVNLTGAGNVTVTTGATPLVIVSGNTGAYANFITPSQSGLLTGAFYPLNSNPAGYLTSSAAGVTSIVATGTTNSGSLTGVVKISGAGNVTIFTGISGSIIVSGNTGQLTGQFYPLYTNPSGYIMGTTGTGILDGQLLIGSSGINGFQQGDLYATTGLVILSGSGSLGVGIDVSKVVTGLVAGSNVSVSNNGTGLWTINATSAGSSGINSITTTGAFPSGIRSGSVFISGAGNVTVTTGTNNSIVVSGAGGGGVAAGINTVGATGTLNTGYFTGDVLFSGAGSIVVSTGNTSSKLIVISGGINTVNNLYTVANFSGLNKMWIPAAAMTPSQITGATTGQIFTAGSGHTIDTLNFLSGSGQSAYFNLSFPKVWDKTNVVPVFYWTTTGNVGTINWGIAGANIDDGTRLDIQYNQGYTITDSTISGNYLHQTTGVPLNISGTLSDDDQCYFKVYRSAGGTLADEGKLIGVGIAYYETGVNATPSGINSITTTGAFPSGLVTGNVVVSGAGTVSVYTGDFGSIVISGASVGGPGGAAGVNSIAATGTINTGYHTGDVMFTGAGNIVVSTGTPINKLIIVSGDTGAYANFVTLSQTGGLVSSANTGNFVTTGQTGLLTNVFYPLNTNPSNYLTSATVGGVRMIVPTGTTQSGNISGNVILTGAGNVTVFTGNQGIIIISGSGSSLTNMASGTAYTTGITQGVDRQFISFPVSFSVIPTVVADIQLTTGNNIYNFNISGISTSGFYALYSNIIAESGHLINVMAYSGQGIGVVGGGGGITLDDVNTFLATGNWKYKSISGTQINPATTIDWRSGSYFYHSLTGNTTFVFTGYRDAQTITIKTVSTGGFNITWPTGVRWPLSTFQNFSGTSGSVATGRSDIWSFITMNNYIHGSFNPGFYE